MANTVPILKENRVVFACGATDYTVGDVLEAAHFRGELEAPWQEFLLRVEADRKGQASDLVLDESTLDEAAIAFRYKYDLITAEETERWLEARSLNLSEFSEYLARIEWAKEFAGRVEAPSIPFAGATVGQRDLFVVDLTLSGELDGMAARLAWRVAALAAVEQEKERKREGGLAEMEEVYRRSCEQRLTSETRQRELGALRLPLTRFEVEMIELESRDAAREAFMCVRDDGMSMAEVAREGRYPFRETELVLEQIPEEMQQKFLSLTPGSLLEPTAREDGFVLTRLLQKREPKLDDPEVLARVDERILERHFADVSSGRIQWRIAMNGTE